MTVHEGDLSKGLAAALGSIDSDFDVVISRGGTAQMLEDELSLPVIEIDVSATDLLEALARHNPQGRRTAVIGFSNALRAVSEVADFSDFDLDVYGVSFEDELPIVLEDVASGDYPLRLLLAGRLRRTGHDGTPALVRGSQRLGRTEARS